MYNNAYSKYGGRHTIAEPTPLTLKNVTELIDMNWKIKKFADKLKDMVCMFIGCTREQLESSDFKNSPLNDNWLVSTGEIAFASLPGKPRPLMRPMTVREVLQKLGTEAIRNGLHPEAWVNALFSDYILKKETDVYPKWIITDMRFLNEYTAVKKRNGICIRINAGGYNSRLGPVKFRHTKDGIIEVSDVNQHESETALDKTPEGGWDEYVENTGSLEDLYKRANEIVTKYNLQ